MSAQTSVPATSNVDNSHHGEWQVISDIAQSDHLWFPTDYLLPTAAPPDAVLVPAKPVLSVPSRTCALQLDPSTMTSSITTWKIRIVATASGLEHQHLHRRRC